MAALDIRVVGFRVDHRRRDVRVAQEPLQLVRRHPAADGHRGHRVAEGVGRDVRDDTGAQEDPRHRFLERL